MECETPTYKFLEHFSALPQTEINSSIKLCPRHEVFHYFLSEDSKQDAATDTAQRKQSTIWGNTDGCADQYRCASILYLMSVSSQFYSIVIDRSISAHGHGK